MVRKGVCIKISRNIVQIEGYAVHYQEAGEGEPVILVHGLSGSSLWWGRNVPSLARRYRVYLVDLPGFGMMRRSRFVLANAAAWLLKWMDAVGLKRAHFIGHSMGGYVCLWLAAHHPDVVERLVLVAPAVEPQAKSVIGYLGPLLSGIRYLTPHFAPILLYDALRAGPITLLKATRELLTVDVREEVEAIIAPTLLVWGEGDALVPMALGDILHKEIATSRLIVLKRGGHVCMFNRYEEFNEKVLAFLSGESVGCD